MTKAPLPQDETARLLALRAHEILDTEPEQAYDDLARLAAFVCGTKVAVVSFVDAERQWFKARVGEERTETPRDWAFCAHAILTPGELLVVDDATKDARFAGSPLVTEEPGIRFYAGAPLRSQDGHALGALCAIDRVPRQLSAEQRAALDALRRQLEAQLALRRLARDLSDALARVRTLSGLLPICAACKKIRDGEGHWHPVEDYVRARSQAQFSHGICPPCREVLYGDIGRPPAV